MVNGKYSDGKIVVKGTQRAAAPTEHVKGHFPNNYNILIIYIMHMGCKRFIHYLK